MSANLVPVHGGVLLDRITPDHCLAQILTALRAGG
jgi:hypothetical protein